MSDPVFEHSYNSWSEESLSPEPLMPHNCVSFGTQTDLEYRHMDAMNFELLRQREEIEELQMKIKCLTLKEESFQNDDSKMKFFTGLPSVAVFMLILSTMDNALNTITVKGLNNFQKLVLTLYKLRTNATFRSLSYRFDIRPQQASYCFKNVVLMFEYQFRSFISWPDPEITRTVVPECFVKSFGKKIAGIVDCFEIRTDRPSNTRARCLSFSNYKHTETGKYAIVIGTTGNIIFISDGYNGRTSDKYISENCGFLDNLLPGEILLADRGFTIKEEVSLRYAKLITLDFREGRDQLPGENVEKSRKVSSVRIHIERVIGALRNKYRILKGPVPLQFLKEKFEDKCFLDYIVRSCCILTNLCDGLIPMDSKQCKTKNNIAAANFEELVFHLLEYCD